jgi:hypothetical protein
MLYHNVFWPSELIKFYLKYSLFKNLLSGKADISGTYQVTFLPGIVLMPEELSDSGRVTGVRKNASLR